MRIKKVFLMLLFCIGMFSSCTKEDLSDCPRQEGRVVLTYNYLLNMDYKDLFGEQVYDLKVFFFNQEGILCDTLMPAVSAGELRNGWKQEVYLSPGSYTIMTWGGDKGFGNSFRFADNRVAGSGTTGEVIIGQTKLEDFRTQLKCLTDPTHDERLVPQTQWFSSLFHGLQSAVIIDSKEETVIATSLIKDANTIRVKLGKLSVLGNPEPDETDFDIQLTGRNGLYQFDNTIAAEAPVVRYEAGKAVLSNDSLRKDISTLRLTSARENITYSSPLLTVTYKPTGLVVCKDLDVTDLILKSKIPARDSEGNILKDSGGSIEMVYPTSEYLDRQDLFEITFDITEDVNGKLVFTVYVNGWKIQNIIPEH